MANVEEGATVLDEEIARRHSSQSVSTPDVRIDGAGLLNSLRTFISRFAVLPDEQSLTAVTLWAAHTHMIEEFHTTPRLALLSPEPASGKTRVLEILALLVPESFSCVNLNPAPVFRMLSKRRITLLVDECDAIFGRRGKDDANEDLRALLNSGYKRGATIPRCVGPNHDVQMFAVYCAAALAGLGDLPETILSRSIPIRMRRRSPSERVEPFRTRDHEPVGHELRDQFAAWAYAVAKSVGLARPTLPEGVVDRQAEVWEPLLAVAEAAGGPWPEAARQACRTFTAPQAQPVTLGVRLLADLRTIFGAAPTLHTVTILERLCNPVNYGLDADAPWGDMYGKPLSDRGLASTLRRYGVSSEKVKIGGQSLQGYRSEKLWDAWTRYLPARSAEAEPPEPLEPNLGPAAVALQVPQVPEVPVLSTPEGDSDEVFDIK
jgi:hypothetical protein